MRRRGRRRIKVEQKKSCPPWVVVHEAQHASRLHNARGFFDKGLNGGLLTAAAAAATAAAAAAVGDYSILSADEQLMSRRAVGPV